VLPGQVQSQPAKPRKRSSAAAMNSITGSSQTLLTR
jgi:hypothetical protein